MTNRTYPKDAHESYRYLEVVDTPVTDDIVAFIQARLRDSDDGYQQRPDEGRYPTADELAVWTRADRESAPTWPWVRRMAARWSDHPDYQEAWKP